MFKGFFLINEADVDETIAEPTEKDVKVKADDDTADDSTDDDDTADDSTDDSADDSTDDDTADDSTDDDTADDSTDDDGTASSFQQADNMEKAKKLRLFKDYKSLQSITEDLKDSFSKVDTSNLSDTDKKIFIELNKNILDCLEKLDYVMTYNFINWQYQKLLTAYIYLKSNINIITEILQKISHL